MMNIKKFNYNLILGILLGFVLSQIVILEGYSISFANKESTGVYDGGNWIFNVLALIIFIVTVAIFNSKKLKKINMDRLSIYLILVILVSIIGTFEGIIIITRILYMIFPNITEYIINNSILSINLAGLSVIFVVFLFLGIFISLVNRKVKYIKFLTKEVKAIENEGFGKTIQVKGGDELADLCKSINSMSVELGEKIENEKRIENNKNELITNISHDLKTPLTSIVGYLEVLNSKNLDDKTREEYIKIAYNKSLRLKSLVNELFEYTKLTGSDMKLDKHRVNISMLLNQAVGESIINFIDKDINVVLDNQYNEAFCNIDAVQMLRVFENLIRNAEKYGDCNSDFKISLNVIDNKVLISFMNKCESINTSDIEQLFEKFYRTDKSRNKEGAGLGLAIVKRIVELHDGVITVEKIDDNIKFNIILNEA